MIKGEARKKKKEIIMLISLKLGISLTTAELYYYAAKNPRIKEIKKEYNVGWSKARELYYKEKKDGK